MTIDGLNHHLYKTARIGVIQPDGQIKENMELGRSDQARSLPRGIRLGQGPLQLARGRRGQVEIVLAQLFVGISVGSILLLIALGLTFTFGQMNVLNMAHGEFIMAGAYTTYVLQQVMGDRLTSLSFMMSLPAAFLLAGAMGVVLERLLIRRFYGRPPSDTLLVTWGVSLMLQQLARQIFGAPNVEVRAPRG